MTGKVSLCPVAPGEFASVRDRRAIAKQTDDVHVAPAVWKSAMLSLTSTPVAAVTRRPRQGRCPRPLGNQSDGGSEAVPLSCRNVPI